MFRFVFRFGCGVLCSVVLFGCSRTDVGPAKASPQWVTTESGVGPLKLGTPRSDLVTGGSVIGATGGCEIVRPQGAPEGVYAMVMDGSARRFDITEPGVSTVMGIGVDSTEDQLRRAYPWPRVELHKYVPNGHIFTVEVVEGPAAGRKFVFETDGARVIRYRVGVVPQVDWVEACG